jgi:hypothetical protein
VSLCYLFVLLALQTTRITIHVGDIGVYNTASPWNSNLQMLKPVFLAVVNKGASLCQILLIGHVDIKICVIGEICSAFKLVIR